MNCCCNTPDLLIERRIMKRLYLKANVVLQEVGRVLLVWLRPHKVRHSHEVSL